MADVVTYAKSGEPIKNGGVVTSVDKVGNHQYYGPSGINSQTASTTYTTLENLLTDRFDDDYFGANSIAAQ